MLPLQDGTNKQFLHTTRALRMLRLAKVMRHHHDCSTIQRDSWTNHHRGWLILLLCSAPFPAPIATTLAAGALRWTVGGGHCKFITNIIYSGFSPFFISVICRSPTEETTTPVVTTKRRADKLSPLRTQLPRSTIHHISATNLP